MVKKKGGAPKAQPTTRKTSGDRPGQKNRRPTAAAGKPKGTASKADEPKRDGTRLNKFIANSGVCSRREADKIGRAHV